jgi:hypothetical protein
MFSVQSMFILSLNLLKKYFNTPCPSFLPFGETKRGFY